jgi:hypothetical protein
MLYAIKHPHLPLIKVGFSADVSKRMAQYASHGLWVKPFRVTNGGREEEMRVHAFLRARRCRGEWFHCSREAVDLAMDWVQIKG